MKIMDIRVIAVSESVIRNLQRQIKKYHFWLDLIVAWNLQELLKAFGTTVLLDSKLPLPSNFWILNPKKERFK